MSNGWREDFISVSAALAAFGLPAEFNDMGGIVGFSYLTPNAIDALTLGATLDILPPLPGYAITAGGVQFIFDDDAAGTISTAATAKIGNNGARDNLLSATAGAPVGNGIVPAARRIASSPITIGEVGKDLVDLTTPPTVEVTIAATGVAAVANMRALVRGVLLRLADF